MGKKLIEAMVKMYIENDGSFCPFCESYDIETMETELENFQAVVHCHKCGETWKDIYKLVGVSHSTGEIVLAE